MRQLVDCQLLKQENSPQANVVVEFVRQPCMAEFHAEMEALIRKVSCFKLRICALSLWSLAPDLAWSVSFLAFV